VAFRSVRLITIKMMPLIT